MEKQLNNCEGFAKALGLEAATDDLYVGKFRGFPVGLKFIDPHGAILLLFQIRHWQTENSPQVKAVAYGEEIATLLKEKRIQIEIDDRIAWLTISDLGEQLKVDEVAGVLDSVLQSFEKAGLIGDPELCHYCQKEKVPNLSAADGKVAQICPACLNERVSKTQAAASKPTSEAVPIFLMTPFAAAAGAALWAGCWMLFSVLLDSSKSDTVVVPRLLIALIALVIGLVAGAPVGGIIRWNGRRGNVASASAAILFGGLAVAGGEILYLSWLIWRWYDVFSLSVAARVLPDYYGNSDPIFLALKFMAAVVTVVLAYEMGKPDAVRLKL
ncbi:MAG TPA: hypothetical protein VFZ59_23960 [Verrucomicrobiae bacterium]|nr:hypothetical protein [Verrucomicrobiae bacterium]